MAERYLAGVNPFIFELARHEDLRGSWTRIFDSGPLREVSDFNEIRQVSISHSRTKYTIRGMHYLRPEAEEWKFVCCLKGSVLDQVVQVKPPHDRERIKMKFLLEGNLPSLLVIPPGWAHGFQTLEPDTSLLYLMTADYDASLERGFRYDDPELKLKWPHKPSLVSPKDLSWGSDKEDQA